MVLAERCRPRVARSAQHSWGWIDVVLWLLWFRELLALREVCSLTLVVLRIARNKNFSHGEIYRFATNLFWSCWRQDWMKQRYPFRKAVAKISEFLQFLTAFSWQRHLRLLYVRLELARLGCAMISMVIAIPYGTQRSDCLYLTSVRCVPEVTSQHKHAGFITIYRKHTRKFCERIQA